MSAPSRKYVTSASKQIIYSTYVCLIGNIKPENSAGTCESDFKRPSFHIMDVEAEEIDINEEDAANKGEREEATEGREMDTYVGFPNTEAENSTSAPSDIESTDRNDGYNNPQTLKLTRMKWLSDSHDGSPDASSPLLSPTGSLSQISDESDDLDGRYISERHLSTILRLDREHNLFGLSHMTIVDLKPSKKQRKDEEKPVFPQTAIVQICCLRQCCRHKSRTSLPSSLRCGRCHGSCCFDPGCQMCPTPCSTPCGSSCKTTCPPLPIPCPPKCPVESNCCGLQIKVFRKPKYEQTYKEIYPRAPCELAKPFAARECNHCPRCIPPSPYFPYIMPCFWPSREGAPCSEPARCFHTPPCPKGRVRKTCVHAGEKCPIAITGDKCINAEKNTTCTNLSCVGRNEELKKELESRFGKNATPPAPKHAPAPKD